jgi:hypothetical protein
MDCRLAENMMPPMLPVLDVVIDVNDDEAEAEAEAEADADADADADCVSVSALQRALKLADAHMLNWCGMEPVDALTLCTRGQEARDVRCQVEAIMATHVPSTASARDVLAVLQRRLRVLGRHERAFLKRWQL